jgi:hypothetical protein
VSSFNSGSTAGIAVVGTDSTTTQVYIDDAGTVRYQINGGAVIATSMTASVGLWYEIKFVIDDRAGVTGYWNDVEILSSTGLTDISKIRIGSTLQGSSTADSAYDDISFRSDSIQKPYEDNGIAFPAVLEHDDQPIILLGMYDYRGQPTQATFDARFSLHKLAGFNTVLFADSSGMGSLATQQKAAQAGINVPINIIQHVHQDAVKGVEPLSVITDQFTAVSGYSSILGWYTADEPGISAQNISPQRLQTVHSHIESLERDPRPQFVVFCRPEERYLRAEPDLTHDVMMVDPYPCRVGTNEFESPLYDVPRVVRKQVLLCHMYPRQAQMAVLQACGYGDWDSFRLPTYSEQRHMAWSAIIEGARGLIWWNFAEVVNQVDYTQDAYDYRHNVIGPTLGEITDLSDAIISNAAAVKVSSPQHIDTTGHGVEDITMAYYEDDTYTYLVAANNTDALISGVDLELRGYSLGSADGASSVLIPVLYESRNVNLVPVSKYTWQIEDDFGPYDINIYRIDTTSTILPAECADLIIRGTSATSDINGDCRINLEDIAIIAGQWQI